MATEEPEELVPVAHAGVAPSYSTRFPSPCMARWNWPLGEVIDWPVESCAPGARMPGPEGASAAAGLAGTRTNADWMTSDPITAIPTATRPVREINLVPLWLRYRRSRRRMQSKDRPLPFCLCPVSYYTSDAADEEDSVDL